jgi:hypothetical protein
MGAMFRGATAQEARCAQSCADAGPLNQQDVATRGQIAQRPWAAAWWGSCQNGSGGGVRLLGLSKPRQVASIFLWFALRAPVGEKCD